MARYSIEVESVYAISALAPLAELLDDGVEDSDPESNTVYLVDSLACLLGELNTGGVHLPSLQDHVDRWEFVAGQLEDLAAKIRQNLVPND